MPRAGLALVVCVAFAACGGGGSDAEGADAAGEPTQSAAPAGTSVAAAPDTAAASDESAAAATALAVTTQASGSWAVCASEHQVCTIEGTRKVRYGTAANHVTKTLTGSATCNSVTFGSDPAKGTLKSCWVEGGSTAAASTRTGPRVGNLTPTGPITATAGQVISGVRIQNPSGPCITVPAGAKGVVIRDSDIGPCGGAANIFIEGANALVEHVHVHHGKRGVVAHRTSNVTTRFSRFDTFYGPKFNGTAIEYDYMASGRIEGNVVRGSNYASDAISVFESSNLTMVDNDIDIHVAEPSAAAFTMGDATGGNPGANNYVARNIVKQRGGVPAGVFGSSGNTILEKNCLSAGIQAYNYAGTFVGITVRNNVIHMRASFVPDPGALAGWSTNIDSTDCSRVPR